MSTSGKCPKVSEKEIVGSSNEVSVLLNNLVETHALLDTGSCVSTLSKTFYEKHLSHVELMPLDNLLRLECASGQTMPYYGYIEIDIQSTGVPDGKTQTHIFVPIIHYSCHLTEAESEDGYP